MLRESLEIMKLRDDITRCSRSNSLGYIYSGDRPLDDNDNAADDDGPDEAVDAAGEDGGGKRNLHITK